MKTYKQLMTESNPTISENYGTFGQAEKLLKDIDKKYSWFLPQWKGKESELIKARQEAFKTSLSAAGAKEVPAEYKNDVRWQFSDGSFFEFVGVKSSGKKYGSGTQGTRSY